MMISSLFLVYNVLTAFVAYMINQGVQEILKGGLQRYISIDRIADV
jgi:hypothetical protein